MALSLGLECLRILRRDQGRAVKRKMKAMTQAEVDTGPRRTLNAEGGGRGTGKGGVGKGKEL